MSVSHQVADQAAIIADALGAFAVGDAGGLDDGRIIAHVLDQADKAIVETLDEAAR